MRKLVVVLIVLAVLLVILDRVAVSGVQREIARQVEAKYDLDTTPSVEVKGIPFLTQAISGHYDEISIAMGRLTRQGVTLSKVDATVYDVTAPLADLIQNAAGTDITAQRVTGTIVISRETINAKAPKGIKVSGNGGDTLQVSGNANVLGQSIPITADMKMEVVPGGIRLRPVNVKVAGGISIPNPDRLMTFTVPVKDLPLNLKITSVASTPAGLAIRGTASDVPLR